MNHAAKSFSPRPTSDWAPVLAFALVYLSWGTTYLAIQKGVEAFPPALFGGVRVTLAGLLLFAYMAVRGQPLGLLPREYFWTGLVGVLLFVGGNGLITLGEKSVASGIASVLVATTPLWLALLEMIWPWGEKLRWRGWLGLFAGLGGVFLLLAPKFRGPASVLQDSGPLLVLGSSLSWSVGSFVLRHRRLKGSHLAIAAYQMVLGGGSLLLLGLLAGETQQLALERFTPGAVYAFFHLLVFGSLVGFVAYTWLLGHVSAPLAGTYAYVNPVIAILVGWAINGEAITGWLVGGMAIILAGVALVRSGVAQASRPKEREIGSKQTELELGGPVCQKLHPDTGEKWEPRRA
jgi:drug/metabolite transporter (DMT)-like permease